MAVSTRTKKKVITNVSVKDAEDAANIYAFTKNKLVAIEAEMNAELNRVKEKYQDKITTYKENLAEPETILEAFANEQKSSWGKKKSYEFLHATIGYRTGNPTVSKDKKFTWDGVLELVKKHMPGMFVRTKDELNKEAILAEKNEAILNQLKEDCFIEIKQDESFYVEAKVEKIAD